MTRAIDPDTAKAVEAFLAEVARRHAMADALIFGSRARGEARRDSDADVAVVLRGTPGHRVDAALEMADIAFDVMMQTGILVDALPLWEEEWEHPERFSNPVLIENIRRDGVRL